MLSELCGEAFQRGLQLGAEPGDARIDGCDGLLLQPLALSTLDVVRLLDAAQFVCKLRLQVALLQLDCVDVILQAGELRSRQCYSLTFFGLDPEPGGGQVCLKCFGLPAQNAESSLRDTHRLFRLLEGAALARQRVLQAEQMCLRGPFTCLGCVYYLLCQRVINPIRRGYDPRAELPAVNRLSRILYRGRVEVVSFEQRRIDDLG